MRPIISIVHRILFLSVCLAGLSQQLHSRPTGDLTPRGTHHTTIHIAPGDTTVLLPHQFIIAGSEKVKLDTLRLERDKDYYLNARFGIVTLVRSNARYVIDSLHGHTLDISYQSLPFIFQPVYSHRDRILRLDSMTGQKANLSKASAFSVDDLFGSNLQKSGSLVRGFSVGTNRDLSLNSGFRMQMSGNLTNDLQVIAALTDENSPIQPEGTTQTLQEIDKVFVEIRGSSMSATLGDFNLNLAGNEFANLNRKLQGAKGSVNFGGNANSGDALISGAVTRGKFTTNQFPGIDGVQGPYILFGQNNERTIIVIAGSERVYINGEQMSRGELKDYVIDYATSEITFASRRVISAVSRITVDFEYSDRQFQRNLVGGKAGAALFDNALTIHTTIVREADDENSTIDATLSDEDKDTLRLSGNDRSKAVRTGVTYVGPGKGQYRAVDTLYISDAGDTVRTTFYRFDPTDTLGRSVYSITFSYAGAGRGDYAKISSVQFQFVGVKRGSYVPLRFLPMPQSTTLADIDFTARLGEGVQVSGEFAHSNFRQNLYSSVQDDGSALKFGLEVSPTHVRLGNSDIGQVGLQFKERYVGQRYVSLDRFNDVEFNRNWNLNDSALADEEIREGTLTYKPDESLRLAGNIGSLSRGDIFSSHRYSGAAELHDKNFPDLTYSLELIKSRTASDTSEGTWIRNHGALSDTLGSLLPSLRYEGEILRNANNGMLRFGSFRYYELTPAISWNLSRALTMSSQFGMRWEDSLRSGELQRASSTVMQRYGLQLNEGSSLSTNLDVALRDRTFTDQFKQGNLDRIQTILVRSQTHIAPFNRGIETDLYYEGASERSAKLEQVFQQVPKGTGNYVYAGDLNNNHVADPPDFQLSRFDGDFIAVLIPTDELIPVTNVKASTRFRINGSRLAGTSGLADRILSSLSSETYARVEERSSESDTKQIYLLHFSRFLDDQTTLLGTSIITQDLYVLEDNPEFSLRFRYNQRRGLTQFALQNERSYQREQSFRLKWQFVKEIANQIDFAKKADVISSPSLDSRTHGVGSTIFSSDWTYRPEQQFELGFKFGFGEASNYDTTRVSLNDQNVHFLYAIAERAQARAEMTREEVTPGTMFVQLPFELTGGRVPGKTWLWQIGVDYRISQVVQASLNYDGREEGGEPPVHTAKAEVRAFF